MDFGHVLPLLVSDTVDTTDLKHKKKKKKKKKKKRRKSQDFDIWTTPHRLSCLINGMRDRREGEKGNTPGKGEQYKGKVLAFYDWAIKAAIEVYHSRSLLIPINK